MRNISTFFLIMFLSFNNASATLPPFEGGSLYIQTVFQDKTSCIYSNKSSFPSKSMQYFFNGKRVWQISINGSKTIVRELLMPENAWTGYGYLQKIALENQDRDYPCAYHLNFNPKNFREHSRDLSKAGLRIGKLKKVGEAWYWGSRN